MTLAQESLPLRAGFAAAAKGELCARPAASASFNASALACLLQQSSLELKDFEWTENERPLIAHDHFKQDENLPAIDVAPLFSPPSSPSSASSSWPASASGAGDDGGEAQQEEEKEACVRTLLQASRDWGFFQVTGHGVPLSLTRRMQSFASRFFHLPLPLKRRFLRDPSSASSTTPVGYAYAGVGTSITSDFPWLESLQLPASPGPLLDYASKIWPDEAHEFRDVVREYSEAMRGLTMRILEVLITNLDGGSDYFEMVKNAVGGDHENSVLRLNCYPPCPQPSLTLGLGAHSDPHVLTVLHQDQVGGLQIRNKDSQWIAVRPNANAFVVNIGDVLQVWSNDLYKSVEHRAVCNNARSRLSMALFLNPTDESSIAPFCGLHGVTKSPRYKPFTWKEYRACMYTNRLRGKSNLQHFRFA